MGMFDEILISEGQDGYEAKLAGLLGCHSMDRFLKDNAEIAERVRGIVKEVGARGDEAVAEFTERFDGVRLRADDFRVSEGQLAEAHGRLDAELLGAMRESIENVMRYQKMIFVGSDKGDGVCGIRYRALKRVGVCVPGASAPLPSTVIMTVVPAAAAGVDEIAVVSPPRYEGSINPVILGLCYELGVKEVYRIGGAQAVAALGWGTESVAKVDKIVGPGNDYVQLAKKEVFGLVDMDSFAGPSDVVIIADDSARADWLAADMLSQAEHYPGAAILVTDSERVAGAVAAELERQVEGLDRRDETAECLLKYSGIVAAGSMDKAVELVNEFAAEHLEVVCGERSEEVAGRIENAGAIFIGGYSPVAVGDYRAGPSHTLPTRQSSRYFSALTSNDFVKSSSIIKYDAARLRAEAEGIIRLAMVEGLDAHAKSVRMRLGD